MKYKKLSDIKNHDFESKHPRDENGKFTSGGNKLDQCYDSSFLHDAMTSNLKPTEQDLDKGREKIAVTFCGQDFQVMQDRADYIKNLTPEWAEHYAENCTNAHELAYLASIKQNAANTLVKIAENDFCPEAVKHDINFRLITIFRKLLAAPNVLADYQEKFTPMFKYLLKQHHLSVAERKYLLQ